MWTHEQILVHSEEPPDIYGKCRGRLLVVGAGRCLWDDLDTLGDSFDAVMGINLATAFYPGRMDHMVTLEGKGMASIALELRERLGFKGGHIHVHTNKIGHHGSGIVWDIDHDVWAGTSGLFGVVVGAMLGYDKITIAGMPLDNGGRFFDRSNSGSVDYASKTVARAWDKFMGLGNWPEKVRACSGKTGAWFGLPGEGWAG